jgi:hypothetical protein
MAPKPKDKESLIQNITNRYRVTAREARDIVTAIGTVGNAAYNTISVNKKVTPISKKNLVGSVKNLGTQVKETAVANVTGVKGTTSAQSGGRASGYKFTKKSGGTFQERELKPGKSRNLTRQVGSSGKALTPAQLKQLKMMMRSVPRLDK